VDEETIGKVVIDCAMKVHTALGPGLLESAYEACLDYELRERGIATSRQQELPIRYGDVELDAGYRLDLLVGDGVVVELKVVEGLNDIHLAQILSYMKLGGFRLGYLLNFNVKQMRQGIRRVVNQL